jgi:RNA polymerase sigma-70 factor (ECF subfamily)
MRAMNGPLRAVGNHGTEREPVRVLPVELSFDEFFEAERGRLFGALIIVTGNRAEAEELLQDAFLKVWERWERVAVMDEPVGFLYRTAMNLHRKRIRRAAVALRKGIDLLPDIDELADVETRDEAVRLLGRLTPRERAAIVVTGYLGYSSEEAGGLLGIRAQTVRVLTSRARATLRAAAAEGSS